MWGEGSIDQVQADGGQGRGEIGREVMGEGNIDVRPGTTKGDGGEGRGEVWWSQTRRCYVVWLDRQHAPVLVGINVPGEERKSQGIDKNVNR